MLVRICFFIKFLCYLLSLCVSDMYYYSFNYCTLSTRPAGIRVLCTRFFTLGDSNLQDKSCRREL